MTRKILWMLLSFLLVAALVLTSCAKKEVVGEQEEEEEVVPPVGEPIYGGTLTLRPDWNANEPGPWDAAELSCVTLTWGCPYYDFLLVGDIESYGPRGTNEYAFANWETVPEQYLRGALAESWEWTDPLTLVFHMRQGVYWQDKPPVNGREFTAYDAEYSMNRLMETAIELGQKTYNFIDSITATDRYTLVIECNAFKADWAFRLGYGLMLSVIQPEEVVEAGAEKWENQVGTGPFILTEFVEGSQAIYERNPNYWRTTTINGKEYPLPFIDTWVWPIIPDESSQIAALRTGAVDWQIKVPLRYMDTLTATSPDLILDKYLQGSIMIGGLNMTQEPWNNRNVRRAMMIGLDWETLGEAGFTEYELHAWPFNSLCSAAIYTPMDELPESAQLLWSNDPGLAKQMLADEGYPDGFSMEIWALPEPVYQDMTAMMVDMWTEIGVTAEISQMETGAAFAQTGPRTYQDCFCTTMVNTGPDIVFMATGLIEEWDWAAYDDEYFTELYWKAVGTVDLDERNALWKELAIYFLEDVPYLPWPNQVITTAYWPWLKNYYGETEGGYYNFQPMVSLLWIDQELKAELGY